MKKKGLMIINPFLGGKKYDEIYSFLTRAFKRRGALIEVKTTAEFSNKVGNRSIIDKNEVDFVIFWDKDIYLAEAIERAGVRVFNSADAIRLCDNKILTCKALSDAGVRIPETIAAPKTFENIGYTDLEFLKNAGDALGYPFVIKEAYGSYGQQVYLANDFDEACAIVKSVGGREILMQKFIKESRGRDIRVNVVGGRVIASIYRENKNDFRSNISNGGTACPYEPTEEQKNAAIAALNAVSADFGGVDILLNDGEPIVIEVNSNMHFVSTYNTTGIDLSEYIAEHVLKAI